ncbi:MAG: glycosyltransferase family 4 protein [Gammaproteobacteria bacterium]|nr:glycosyltransferase family 4 protein [Gammaproteobacteria bacterium]MDH3467684.1 glycosyltransferase family 4 protein [Gammaproteobacteria bacterium]
MSAGGRVEPRIAIVATHPIQYQVPWYENLNKTLSANRLIIYYGIIPSSAQQGIGFDRSVRWDIPLLHGYEWQSIGIAKSKHALERFWGLRTVQFANRVQADGIDIAILTGWYPLFMLQALLACRRSRVPVIVRGESNDLKQRPYFTRLLQRLLLNQFDGFLTIGKQNRQFYQRHGIPEQQLYWCPYFVDNTRFERQSRGLQSSRQQLRRQWNIDDDAQCVLFCGKLIPKKRIRDLVQSMDAAYRRNSNLHLLIAGDGEQRQEAEQYCRQRGLPATFAGFLNQTEISTAYVAADCLVVSSDAGETWGLVVNEAMASGLPVIVSDQVGCAVDLVKDDVTGRIYRCGDVAELAELILDSARNSQHWKAMGLAAQSRVCDEYSVEKAVAGTIAAINGVWYKRRSPG